MGCCHGKLKNPKPDPSLKNPNHRRRSPETTTNRSPPPPPPIEEETVKEVLSETPIPKPACFKDRGNNVKTRNEMHPTVEDEVKIDPTAVIPACFKDGKKRNEEMHPTVEEKVKINPTAVINSVEEASVLSEMSETVSYTFSESLSTATEKRDDDGEVNQRVHRSPVKVPRRRNQISGHVQSAPARGVRSPARQSAPSPVKRNAATTAANRRNVGAPGNRIRRDSGECSGRRSRSPATRGEVGQRRPARNRSPAVAVNGRSGDRGPPAAAEDDGERRAAKEEAAESLENPLVSLECFIFV